MAPNLETYPDLREPAGPAIAPLASGAAPRASQPPAGEDLEHLPGAEENPCCMGTMAQEELGVIEGFIEVELADRRTYQAFARRAPAFARGTMRDLANASGAAASGRISIDSWCPALRERYHVEACNGMNYLRAGEETTDPCLGRLLKELGEEAYRQADQLMALLERAL